MPLSDTDALDSVLGGATWVNRQYVSDGVHE